MGIEVAIASALAANAFAASAKRKQLDLLPEDYHAVTNPESWKCEGCGSREWTQHHNKIICSYCRSDRG